MAQYGREDERWWDERSEREGGRGQWRPERERLARRDWRDDEWRQREWQAGQSEGGPREEERREVMQGGDRGWPGGVKGAEGGSSYGRGMFGTAYALYSGRPEHEPYRRHDEDWRHREGAPMSAGYRGYGDQGYRAYGEERAWGQRDERRDWAGQQSRGQPPRAYRRSDERILDDIVERLMIGSVDASEVEIKVENGEVTLSGTVRDRRDKRRIEDACEDVFGVKDVHNQIRVSREAGEGTRPGGGVH